MWDPKYHNHKHVDSYAKAIADRRVWPAKKYTVGAQPNVRSDWNHFSLRNLAYQYNAKLRACNNFPEMIPVYAEMKGRGVKLDSDTMSVMLSRGARFTAITPQDLFLLFEEMLSLGARPDMAVIEVLHTILDHSPRNTDGAWREAKRLDLIRHYDVMCAAEIATLGEQGLGHLMASQVDRYRKNILALDGRLSVTTWRQYVASIPTVEQLFEALAAFLGDYVPKALAEDFPRSEMRFSNNVAIPHLFRHNALSRPTVRPAALNASNSNNRNQQQQNNRIDTLSVPYADRIAFRETFADDLAINAVFLSALERLIDTPLTTRLPRSDETALLLILEKLVKTSGMLVTADLAAQMMEVCKFATTNNSEAAALRIMQTAFHGSAVPTTPYRAHWRAAEVGVDGRVLGRFLAARDPWSTVRFDMSATGKFENFSDAAVGTPAAADAVDADPTASAAADPAAPAAEGADAASAATATSASAKASASRHTAAAVNERWASVQKAVVDSGALDIARMVRVGQPIDAEAMMEVFTGQACFLRTMLLEERYPPTEEQLRAAGHLETDPDAFAARNRRTSAASRRMTVDAAEAIFRAMQGLKRDMDALIVEARHVRGEGIGADGVELVPDLECWESMLLVSKHAMDYLLARRDQGGQGGRQQADDLFKRIAQFRSDLLEESRERFGGRFKILWLQEM